MLLIACGALLLLLSSYRPTKIENFIGNGVISKAFSDICAIRTPIRPRRSSGSRPREKNIEKEMVRPYFLRNENFCKRNSQKRLDGTVRGRECLIAHSSFGRHTPQNRIKFDNGLRGRDSLIAHSSSSLEKWAFEASGPEAGCLLIWEPPPSYKPNSPEEDYFKHTAVLLVEHSETVTTGFVLNQPSMHTVEEAVAINTLPEPFRRAPVFVGGPIGSSLEMLHGVPEVRNCTRIAEGIYYGGDIEHAGELINGGKASLDDFRLMYRFSGWYPGQLNNEIDAGYWRVTRVSPGAIFNRLPTHLVTPLVRPDFWAKVMSQLGNEAAKTSRKEIASLTDGYMVDAWISALTNPAPEAGASVIAANYGPEVEVESPVQSQFNSEESFGNVDEDVSSSLIMDRLLDIQQRVDMKLSELQREVLINVAASTRQSQLPTLEEKLGTLNAIMFGKYGFSLPSSLDKTAEAMGTRFPLYQPQHYQIDSALESRDADPLLLSILYMAMASRIGIDLTPVYLTQLPTKILLRTSSEQWTPVYFIDPSRNGTAFELQAVIRDLETSTRLTAEATARRDPTNAATAGWLPSNTPDGQPTVSGPLTTPNVEGEKGVAPLARVYGQVLMSLANSCVIRGEPEQGTRWKRLARALQEAVDILEVY